MAKNPRQFIDVSGFDKALILVDFLEIIAIRRLLLALLREALTERLL